MSMRANRLGVDSSPPRTHKLHRSSSSPARCLPASSSASPASGRWRRRPRGWRRPPLQEHALARVALRRMLLLGCKQFTRRHKGQTKTSSRTECVELQARRVRASFCPRCGSPRATCAQARRGRISRCLWPWGSCGTRVPWLVRVSVLVVRAMI